MAKTVYLNFHQTFCPEKQYISSILEVANGTDYNTCKEISAQTGIPTGESSGKVEPHIYYANYMGLINFKKNDNAYMLQRTSLGDTVFFEDPGLQEELTTWICHCMMLREKGGAPLWQTIYRKIMPLYRSGIRKEILQKELNVLFSGKVTTKNMAPFFGSYENFFNSINLLQVESGFVDILSSPINKEFVYLYALVLYEYWDEAYTQQDEISSIQLSEISYGKAFGWDIQREYEVLEMLSDIDVIRLNRQLVPYTLLRMVDKGLIISKLYSELC